MESLTDVRNQLMTLDKVSILKYLDENKKFIMANYDELVVTIPNNTEGLYYLEGLYGKKLTSSRPKVTSYLHLLCRNAPMELLQGFAKVFFMMFLILHQSRFCDASIQVETSKSNVSIYTDIPMKDVVSYTEIIPFFSNITLILDEIDMTLNEYKSLNEYSYGNLKCFYYNNLNYLNKDNIDSVNNYSLSNPKSIVAVDTDLSTFIVTSEKGHCRYSYSFQFGIDIHQIIAKDQYKMTSTSKISIDKIGFDSNKKSCVYLGGFVEYGILSMTPMPYTHLFGCRRLCIGNQYCTYFSYAVENTTCILYTHAKDFVVQYGLLSSNPNCHFVLDNIEPQLTSNNGDVFVKDVCNYEDRLLSNANSFKCTDAYLNIQSQLFEIKTSLIEYKHGVLNQFNIPNSRSKRYIGPIIKGIISYAINNPHKIYQIGTFAFNSIKKLLQLKQQFTASSYYSNIEDTNRKYRSQIPSSLLSLGKRFYKSSSYDYRIYYLKKKATELIFNLSRLINLSRPQNSTLMQYLSGNRILVTRFVDNQTLYKNYVFDKKVLSKDKILTVIPLNTSFFSKHSIFENNIYQSRNKKFMTYDQCLQNDDNCFISQTQQQVINYNTFLVKIFSEFYPGYILILNQQGLVQIKCGEKQKDKAFICSGFCVVTFHVTCEIIIDNIIVKSPEYEGEGYFPYVIHYNSGRILNIKRL